MADDSKLREITPIVDLRPGMKNVTCVFIVIDKGTTNQTKDGSVVRKCRVGDSSASIIFSLWNEQADAIEEGDILRLTKGYASLWKGSMVLYSGKYGILQKIGEFTMVYSESPDMSDTSHDFAQPQAGRGQPPSHRRPDETRTTLNRNGNNHNGSLLEQWGNPVAHFPPQDPTHRDPHTPMPPVAPAGSLVRHRTDYQRARFAPYPRTPAYPPLRDGRQ